ncbi:MAG: hypothetical protein MZV64_12925 [Ignavibacteriales bacterium]|nr:hypothetical protein [Ignavibacteriales bacterium]
MVDRASSRVVQKRWKARPRNVPADGEEDDDREQHGAHLFSRKPATRPRATRPARKRSDPATNAQRASDDLEHRPDDERQPEDALEETAEPHERRSRALLDGPGQQGSRALEPGEEEVGAAAVAVRAGRSSRATAGPAGRRGPAARSRARPPCSWPLASWPRSSRRNIRPPET